MTRAERPPLRLLAFAALGLYGVLRWQTLLSPAPSTRLLAALGVAIALVAIASISRGRRALVAIAVVLAALATLAIAGIPLSWVRHLRVTVTVDAIGQGLAALPRVLVPYNGVNEWVRVVTLLGAGLLLIGAAGILALAPRPLSDGRRIAVAAPLVALAVVPMTLAHPRLPYLQGVILFALLAVFLWGEHVRLRNAALALALAGGAALAALAIAPALDPRSPWINYQSLAGGLAPGAVERFDWRQGYGPLHWPRTGREVLYVQAPHPDYWKAENLSVFDGTGWVSGAVQLDNPLVGVDASAARRWTQTLQVTMAAMNTFDVIASGAAQQPTHLYGVLVPGSAPGTWTSGSELGPGDSYTVTTYAPHPGRAALAAIASSSVAGAGPSAAYRAIELPATTVTPAQPVLFAPFGARIPLESIPGLSSSDAQGALAASPYARVYAMARRLARGARTPYAYVANVERYLTRGFAYDENPPLRQFPLIGFLLRDKRGYCQQFAGAMALLLRMRGIPARVAAGFTTGTYDHARSRYVVTDLDAHAWVEAWFPRYGWVQFDPTPSAAPARGGQAALPALRAGRGGAPRAPAARRAEPRPAATPVGRSPGRASHASSWGLLGLLGVLAAILAVALLTVHRRRPRTPEELLAELERALARCGRPVAGGTTLSALERRFRSSPHAAQYIRALRSQRYGAGSEQPAAVGRRAIRGELRLGLGPLGRLRALWALPPHLNWK